MAVTKRGVAEKALVVASGFAKANIHEDAGANRNEQIDKMEALFGLQGEPYCAMFVAYCYAKSLYFLKAVDTSPQQLRANLEELKKSYFLPSPSCGVMINDALRRGNYVLVEKVSDMQKAQKGDILFWDFAKAGKPPARHVGIFDRVEGSQSVTVEGNTSSGNAGSQNDGGGIYLRHRAINPKLILGFIHIG